MSDYIIKLENLGKKYKIRHQQDHQRYVALRDVIAEKAAAPLRWLREHGAWSIEHGARTMRYGAAGNGRASPDSLLPAPESELIAPRSLLPAPSSEEFWALRGVSFEVKQGEVLGIIGRNGAGKTTLLKILSRITEPTEGRVRIRGRVASLLEVGTGFHPELTGRENIFLNGAILGMTREEIRRKFDEIVDFSGVEKFIDTPVKRYSSGMYVRLAFAVAAHLEPEILIIDEVLAVGDAEFQKKCLGKMEDVACEGRTVLFVSHNMVAMNQLCQKGIWLNNGEVQRIGSINLAAQAYALSTQTEARVGKFASEVVKGDGRVEFVSYRVTNAAREDSPPPGTLEDVLIHIRLMVKETINRPACGISVFSESGVLMTCINSVEQALVLPPMQQGPVTVCVRIKRITFLPGVYTVSFWVMNPQCHIYAMAEKSIVFEIAHVPLYGTCQVDHRWGCVYSDLSFSVESGAETIALDR